MVFVRFIPLPITRAISIAVSSFKGLAASLAKVNLLSSIMSLSFFVSGVDSLSSLSSFTTVSSTFVCSPESVGVSFFTHALNDNNIDIDNNSNKFFRNSFILPFPFSVRILHKCNHIVPCFFILYYLAYIHNSILCSIFVVICFWIPVTVFIL